MTQQKKQIKLTQRIEIIEMNRVQSQNSATDVKRARVQHANLITKRLKVSRNATVEQKID